MSPQHHAKAPHGDSMIILSSQLDFASSLQWLQSSIHPQRNVCTPYQRGGWLGLHGGPKLASNEFKIQQRFMCRQSSVIWQWHSLYTLIPTVYRALLNSAGTDHRIYTTKESSVMGINMAASLACHHSRLQHHYPVTCCRSDFILLLLLSLSFHVTKEGVKHTP